MQQIFKKALVTCLLPLQVMAATPEVSENTTSQNIPEDNIISSETFITTNYSKLLENNQLLNELKDQSLHQRLQKARLLNTVYLLNSCAKNFCVQLTDFENIDLGDEILAKLQKNYTIVEEEFEQYTYYKIKGFNFVFIKDNENESYLISNYGDSNYLKDSLFTMKDLKQRIGQQAKQAFIDTPELFLFASNLNFKNQKNHIFNLFTTDDSIYGTIITAAEEEKAVYNKKIDDDVILSHKNLDLSPIANSNYIQEFDPPILKEIIQELESGEIVGQTNFQLVDLTFKNLTKNLQDYFQSLKGQETGFYSLKDNVEFSGKSVEALIGTTGYVGENLRETIQNYKNLEETKNRHEFKQITGHLYLNQGVLRRDPKYQDRRDIELIAYEAQPTTPDGKASLITFYLNGEYKELVKAVLDLSAPTHTASKDIKIQQEFTDIASDQWFYKQALAYQNSSASLFKSQQCENRLKQRQELLNARSNRNTTTTIKFECTNTSELEAEKNITRAEFATLILENISDSAKIVLVEQNQDNDTISKFNDLKEDHPYYQQMQDALTMGILKGDSNGLTIRPNAGLNRAEAITMLQRTFPILSQTNYQEKTTQFEDVSEDAWYLETLSEAVYEEIIKGTSETTFSPEQKLNRIEAIIMIQRLLEKDFLIETF